MLGHFCEWKDDSSEIPLVHVLILLMLRHPIILWVGDVVVEELRNNSSSHFIALNSLFSPLLITYCTYFFGIPIGAIKKKWVRMCGAARSKVRNILILCSPHRLVKGSFFTCDASQQVITSWFSIMNKVYNFARYYSKVNTVLLKMFWGKRNELEFNLTSCTEINLR